MNWQEMHEVSRVEAALKTARMAIKAFVPRTWSKYLECLGYSLELEGIAEKACLVCGESTCEAAS